MIQENQDSNLNISTFQQHRGQFIDHVAIYHYPLTGFYNYYIKPTDKNEKRNFSLCSYVHKR